MSSQHADKQHHASAHARRRSGDSPAVPITIAICFLLFVFAAILVVGYVCWGSSETQTALAVRLDDQRYPALNPDFFRITFLSSDASVGKVGPPNALRTFFAASSDFVPGIPLARMATYPGLIDEPDRKLVAIRCKASDPSAVDPILATWPNVFQAIKADLADKKFTCPPKAATTDAGANKAFCVAQSFQDPPGASATVVLSSAMTAAATLASDPDAQKWLTDNYGIWPPFSGLGLSIKDSGSSDPMNMNAAVILRNSITTEYLIKNVSLDRAGCHCITVAPYPGRSEAMIDPDFVWERGGDGSCASVKHLN